MQVFLMNFFLDHSSNPDIYYFSDFRCSFQDFWGKKKKKKEAILKPWNKLAPICKFKLSITLQEDSSKIEGHLDE